MTMDIFIDGAAARIDGDRNLLETCLALGQAVPYFCWHPAMGSVGACRQCAVKVFSGPNDNAGRIVMACMTRPEPGINVAIADPQAAAARDAAVEFVLTNHPHDCPVCEVGGECHLQDMTALTGHHARRTGVIKRTHKSQNLGPFIRHEMNRCIGCYRCARFYQDYAGGADFGVFGTARNVFFGRAEDGALESPFAGNLVEVCPTGVFVDKPFSQKFRRKWDMRATPSVCPHCAVGCNTSLHERDGVVRRAANRFNETLNGYFLCDRGRFGVGFLESPQRLGASRDRYGKTLAREAVAAHLARVLATGQAVGIGSARASVESNFVLRRLVGAAQFYAGVAAHEAAAAAAAAAAMAVLPVARLADVERADAALVLGQDPFAAAPILGLALRQAAVRPPPALLAALDIPAWHDAAARTAAGPGHTNPVFVVGPDATALDGVARRALRMDADETVMFAAEVARAVEGSTATQASGVGTALRAAQAPVVVAGGGAAIIMAGAQIVAALQAVGTAARFLAMLPSANSVGLACLAAPSAETYGVEAAHLIVLENDFFGASPAGLGKAASVTALDHIDTATTSQADVAVAVASFADGEGLFVNMEGRVQGFHKAVFGRDDPPAAWEILRDAGIAAGLLPTGAWPGRHELLADMAAELPALAPCLLALPAETAQKPPGLPHRYSGRTAQHAHETVREPKPPAYEASPFGTTMEGGVQTGAAPLVWAPGWNSGQAVLHLPPSPATDVFLFAEKAAAPLNLPAKPWTYTPANGVEEMSALSPAIIARGRP